MEGQYNKVYRARDRVPRPEYTFLLERLVTQTRCVPFCILYHRAYLTPRSRFQIASTLETSYRSLPIKNAISLLFFQPGETSQLMKFAQEVSDGLQYRS